MLDSDLIEAIRKVDGEKLKEAVIEELESLKNLGKRYDDASSWVVFRSCLAGSLGRLGIEL